MDSYLIINKSGYDGKCISVERSKLGNLDRGGGSCFHNDTFETSQQELYFEINGFHLQVRLVKSGTYYLRDTGLYDTKQKVASWRDGSNCVRDIG